jgi:hypothetical protein
MFTITKWIAAPVLAIGLMYAADAPSAQAQYGCYGYGGGGLSIGIGVGRYGGVGAYHSSLYRSRYGGIGSPYYGNHRYSNRGHYDYHPTQAIPHGNHLDVYPGHFDYHRGHHGHHGRGHH